MQSRLDDLSAKEKKDLDAKMQRFNTLTDEQEGIFTEEHPDGFDTIKENFDTFSSWIEDQPKRLRDIYAENSQFISDGTAAAFLVGKFKEALSQEPGSGAGDDEQGQPGSESAPESKENGTARMSGRRRRQMDGARHSSGGPNRMTSAAPAKDSDDAQAHWDHFERMDRQKSATG